MLKIHPKLKETFQGYTNLLMLQTARDITHNRVDETYDQARQNLMVKMLVDTKLWL
jgi:hypothetical protein